MVRFSATASEIRKPEYSRKRTNARARRRAFSRSHGFRFASRLQASMMRSASSAVNGIVGGRSSLGAFRLLAKFAWNPFAFHCETAECPQHLQLANG